MRSAVICRLTILPAKISFSSLTQAKIAAMAATIPESAGKDVRKFDRD